MDVEVEVWGWCVGVVCGDGVRRWCVEGGVWSVEVVCGGGVWSVVWRWSVVGGGGVV